MSKELATILTLSVAGGNLVFVGIIGMLISERFKSRRLECYLKGKELSEEWLSGASLTHSLRELALGILITLAVPIFTHYCLVGSASTLVSIIVGYLAGMLCALGCFSRQHHDLDNLGVGTDTKHLTRILACFAGFLALFLWGVLSLYIAFFFYLRNH